MPKAVYVDSEGGEVGALNYLIAASSDLLELPNQSDGLGGTFLKLD